MMAVPPSPNHRASLLSGLRTGGVRSVSSPLAQAPHTASPFGTFLNSRKSSLAQQYHAYPEEEADHMFASFNNGYGYMPQTAAVGNRMTQQQQQQARQRNISSLNANTPAFVPGGKAALVAEQANAQTDIAHYLAEAMQNPQSAASQETMQFFHQYNEENSGALQAAYIEAVRMTMMQQVTRATAAHIAPATASPFNSFGLDQGRRGSLNGQNQTAQIYSEERLPQTAGLSGRFSNRAASHSSVYDEQPSTPGRTTVISGGISLGTPITGVSNVAATLGPSKSEAAVSWRRGGVNNSVLSAQRAAARESPSPTVRVTPPPTEREIPAPATPTSAGMKARPRPLSLMAQPVPQAVAIDDADDTSSNASSTKSSDEHSSPTTPNSFTSCDAPLSPREAASKKLYEGLGFGRPVVAEAHPVVSTAQMAKPISQILRQPIGPPSNAEEFAPRNFASRIRRKAVGGLGVLMTGRERRLSNVGLN